MVFQNVFTDFLDKIWQQQRHRGSYLIQFLLIHEISKQSSFIFFGDYHNCIDFSLDKMKLSVEFRRNETAQSKLSSHYLNSLEIRIAAIYELPGSRKFYQLLLDRCHIPKLIFLQHIIYYLHIFLRKLFTSIIKRQIFARVF